MKLLEVTRVRKMNWIAKVVAGRKKALIEALHIADLSDWKAFGETYPSTMTEHLQPAHHPRLRKLRTPTDPNHHRQNRYIARSPHNYRCPRHFKSIWHGEPRQTTNLHKPINMKSCHANYLHSHHFLLYFLDIPQQHTITYATKNTELSERKSFSICKQ